ncbi:MAG: hypothetical protein R2798_00910 [Chitinophagales bacterium]
MMKNITTIACMMLSYILLAQNTQQISKHYIICDSDAQFTMTYYEDKFYVVGTSWCDPNYEYDINNRELKLSIIDTSGTVLFQQQYSFADLYDIDAYTHPVIRNDTLFLLGEAWDVEANDTAKIVLFGMDLEGNYLFHKKYYVPGIERYITADLLAKGDSLLIVHDLIRPFPIQQKVAAISFLSQELTLLETKIYPIEDFTRSDAGRFQLLPLDNGEYILSDSHFIDKFSQNDGNPHIFFLDKDFAVKDYRIFYPTVDFLNIQALPLAQQMPNGDFCTSWGFPWYSLGYRSIAYDDTGTIFPTAILIRRWDSTCTNLLWERVLNQPYNAKKSLWGMQAVGDNLLGWGQYVDWDTQYHYGWVFMLDDQGQVLWEHAIRDTRNEDPLNWEVLYDAIVTDSAFYFIGIYDYNQTDTAAFWRNRNHAWFLSLDRTGCWNDDCGFFIEIKDDSTTVSGPTALGLPQTTAQGHSCRVFPNPVIATRQLSITLPQAGSHYSAALQCTGTVGSKLSAGQ